MNSTRYIRGIDDEEWKPTDRPINVPKSLLTLLGVPRDAVTFMLWGLENEQFQDIREAASVLREVLSLSGLVDSLVFTEWLHSVEFQREAASRWLSENVYETEWWDRNVAWAGEGTLRAAYEADIHDFQEFALFSWNEEGRELLDKVRGALLPLPRRRPLTRGWR